MEEIILSVSQFIEVFNQSMSVAFPEINIVGELANFKVSKNKWVYFDLKDDESTLRFFGTVYQLPGPIEDGMMLKVKAEPRLHNQYGLSMNVKSILPTGEGSIKKAAELLKFKLEKEGLFDVNRKRSIPYPPKNICLITSKQSAAYTDFLKVLNHRWQGIQIQVLDVQVQGEIAPEQITQSIEFVNSMKYLPEAIIIMRGGGSAEDLAAFSSEMVTRAVAGSRVPTVVAVGHERDISLAELAADLRASTPSNAAELLVPERNQVIESLQSLRRNISQVLINNINEIKQSLKTSTLHLEDTILKYFIDIKHELDISKAVIGAYSQSEVLKLGYSIVRNKNGKIIKDAHSVKINQDVLIKLYKGELDANVINSRN
ncbi:MAG TPA: exodeoxyribonuclease VII large subunit [Patescibacteria group bacterium]|nr:exodeoxyribonuclease VII large subunit [Patescibacteria group bacterium]